VNRPTSAQELAPAVSSVAVSPIHLRLDATAVVARSLTKIDALVVALAACAWTAAVGWLALWRHDEFLSHRFDLGNMVQSVWSTTRGRPLEMTDGVEQITRLGAHVDPILVLFAPLWWIQPDPETLILGQAAALAAGLYPVVRLALKYTGSRVAAALLGGWYLAFPWILWNAVNDVHPVTLAIPLLLYAIWFLDEHHLGRFALVAVLALACGELVGLTVAALGLWYALARGRPRAGLVIAAGGAAWTAACLLLVIPHFNDGQESRYYSLFESVGGSPTGLVETLFTDPGTVVDQFTTRADAVYVIALLLPTAFLALAQPLLLAIALPQLGVNTLSDFWSTTQPTYQYVSAIVPALVAATIMAIGRFHGHLRLVAAALPLAAAVVCLAWRPPVPGEEDFVFNTPDSHARTVAMRDAVELVPDGAPVMATNRLGGHLSARRHIYLFPDHSRADWAAIDIRDAWLVRGFRVDQRRSKALIAQLERDPAWRRVFDEADIRVYERLSPSDSGQRP
jgi:uncharacterized membrane protein